MVAKYEIDKGFAIFNGQLSRDLQLAPQSFHIDVYKNDWSFGGDMQHWFSGQGLSPSSAVHGRGEFWQY